MRIFNKKAELKSYLTNLKFQNKSIGFVPTMGALHKGHLSLITHAQKKNDIVVVSVFVNPTQFEDKEDLVKYPQTLNEDRLLLEKVSCDILYAPNANDVYDDVIIAEEFDFDGLENKMEGKFRNGHFNGVGTVVLKLLEIVMPDKAYFGEKDFQQLQIIKKLVNKNKILVKIKGRPIFREDDGLAMSSRNVRLTKEYREVAPFIYEMLQRASEKFGEKSCKKLTNWVVRQFDKHPLLKLEYFTIADEKTLKTSNKIKENKKYRGFIAVFAGDIRLIDNIRF